ncbi:MAG: hypothetical protein LBB98_07570 [Treponema sp.]|nr:hypothetical protein [Treponema sp.]
MKKIVVAFFIILILGGTAFFFGWVQFRVPPGSYGVMRSKTHGIDTTVIREGKFRWVWYAAIPTNVGITIFTPKVVEQPIQASRSLPSGDIYASFAGVDVDFSYEYTGSLSFMVKPDYLPVLMAEGGVVNQEDLEAFEGRLADEIASYSVRRLEEYTGEGDGIGDLDADKLKEGILREYPYIENLSCNINTTRRPDTVLYDSIRKIYGNYLAGRYASSETDASLPANRRISARLRFDELEKYGELLTKYPVLLQYLALERGESGKNPEPGGN